MGGHVSDTIRKGMMSVKLYDGDDGRVLVMVGMTSVLLAAATWLLAASKFGLPVSTTHSAVGGVIAFAVTSKGYGSVKWGKVGMIVASWFISPVMSAIAGFGLYFTLKHIVLRHPDSLRRAKMAAPVVVFLMSFVVALFTIYKGGKGIGLHKTSLWVALVSSTGAALALAIAAYPFVSWWAAKITKLQSDKDVVLDGSSHKDDSAPTKESPQSPSPPLTSLDSPSLGTADSLERGEAKSEAKDDSKAASLEQNVVLDDPAIAVKNEAQTGSPGKDVDPDQATIVDERTERLFTGFVVIIAGFFSLAHGANDVANSVGPFGAVLAAHAGPLQKKSEIPMWVFIGAGVMIVVGLVTYGIHVMRTIGNKITPMSPSKAFCVNFAATLVVLIATRVGIPISTTHASVGAVVGVGLADGVRKVDWKIMVKVFLSWILTLPIVAITAAGIFAFLLPCVVNVPFAAPKA